MGDYERFFLDTGSTLLMVIDIQEKLCKAMDKEILSKHIGNASVLLEAARELGVPVLVTEQYPAGLGATLPELKEMISNAPLEKMSFSCCGDKSIMDRIADTGRNRIVVTGMETHICVLQTVLDLLAKGFHVHVVSDCVISRKKSNWRTGLAIASAAGAVVTSTETVLFQLLQRAGTAEFKKLSKLVR
jgi:nicotinamidase-related amidase